MKTIETKIHIDAQPATVYSILMDFEKYPEWNPFVIAISGYSMVGEQLSIHLQSGPKQYTFQPKVLINETDREFKWQGKLYFKGLFDGAHYFKLNPASGGGTEFTHGENFSGLLSGIILRSIGEDTRNNFESMNQALKQRAEQG